MVFGKYVNKYYRRYWKYFLAFFLSDALVDVVQLFIPILIGRAVNDLTSGTFTIVATASLPWYQTSLTQLLFSIGVIAVIMVFGRMGWRFSIAQIGMRIERDIRNEMFTHIQTLSLMYYKDKKVGGLLSFFTNDLATIKQAYTDGLIYLTDLVVLGSLSFVFMMLMSWQITLTCAVPLFLFVVLGGIIGNGESVLYKSSSDAFEDLSDFTEESLQGYAVVKAFRKEKEKARSFRKLSFKSEKRSVSYLRYSSILNASINLFLTLFWSLLMLLCAFSIVTNQSGSVSGFGPGIKEVGDLVTFSGFYDALVWPMLAGGMLVDTVSRGRGSYKRISEILSAQPDVVDDPEATTKGKLAGDFVFKDLTFTYPDGSQPSLCGVSAHIESGMTVGIIGRTGSGKSTFVNILPKLYNIPKGRLFIDGCDINLWKKAELRERIGSVPQEAFLFSGSIADSIAFSEPLPHQADMEKVRKAAAFACIDKDIESFRDGYQTFIGEKGATLSGGQRQRVSIARAIYKNPDVLVLDDSLSAVDAATEKVILANIQENRRGKTTLIIASRISAIERSDWILVLDDGKIVGQGKHEELKKTCPLYSALCTLQELEKEVSV